MNDFKPFLKELMSLPGLSGYESPVRERIAAEWQPLVDELSSLKTRQPARLETRQRPSRRRQNFARAFYWRGTWMRSA